MKLGTLIARLQKLEATYGSNTVVFQDWDGAMCRVRSPASGWVYTRESDGEDTFIPARVERNDQFTLKLLDDMEEDVGNKIRKKVKALVFYPSK